MLDAPIPGTAGTPLMPCLQEEIRTLPHQDLIDRIAHAAALLDPTDLPGAVALMSHFEALRDAAGADGLNEHLARAQAAIDEINKLVMREGDESAHVAAVRSIARQIQDGGPQATSAARIDMELLAAWLPSAPGALDELCNLAVELGGKHDAEQFATLKRGLHTLKGECGVIGLNPAQELCHRMEDALSACETGRREFPADAVLAVLDWLKAYASLLGEAGSAATMPDPPDTLRVVEQIRAALTADAPPVAAPEAVAAPRREAPAEASPRTPKEPADTATSPPAMPLPAEIYTPGPDDAIAVDLAVDGEMRDSAPQFVAELRDHMGGAEQTLLALEGRFTDRELLDALFRAFHTVKGVAGFMHLKPVVELAHAAEALMEAARSGKLTLTDSTLELILKSTDLLNQLLAGVEGGASPSRGAVRQLIFQLGLACAGRLRSATAGSAAPVPASPSDGPDTATSASSAVPAAAPATPVAAKPAGTDGVAGKAPDSVVKVSTSRMDGLIDLVGELVIANQMVTQDPALQGMTDQRLSRNLSHAAKIVRDLQAVSMSLRMVAVKATFQKMSRLVRDVANKTGKKIELRMEGEDTELDRTIVDQINDPLVHMIRNACDHGVEPPEDRQKAGKPASGTVTIRAFHQGGEIVIEVEDDGRGLNRDKLIKKGIERGLIPADRNTAEMSDTEIYNMIFLPGFSTADRVTDISGRGVGMDVVRRNIEALRGRVDLRSTYGRGSTISMRLPLTLAIIDGMIVRVGDQRYVVPTLSIESSFRPKERDLSTVEGGRGEMTRVRNALLPIFRLKRVFGLAEGEDDLTSGLLLVVDANNTRSALMVDEILGQQQVVIKSLGRGSGTIRGVSGGAILGDGRVALILDVGALLERATSTAAAPPPQEPLS
jgi:two-component system chemotaxis sensor kinase CheA